MSLIKTAEEIEIMREGGRILAKVLAQVSQEAKAGVSTLHLDMLARQGLKALGASPSFLNYRTGNAVFPASLCTSVDNALVHGVPSPTFILEPGQIIGLDLGAWYKGLCTDMAVTVAVGKIPKPTQKLIDVTKKSLVLALKKVHAGARIGDIGEAVQTYVEKEGFSVVRDLVGHGVGHAVHEDPRIPNFGKKGTGPLLQEGMTIAIEPMVNAGRPEVKVMSDGWTIVTADDSLAAHFEHTVLVTKHGCEILTTV